MKTSLFFLLALTAIVACTASQTEWTKDHQKISADHPLAFKVALKPQNVDKLDALFWQISDPKSPFFGKFLTNEQIADLISLPEDQIADVEEYLTKDSGKICAVSTKRSVHRDYIRVNTCAGQAKLIFPNLDLSYHTRKSDGKTIVRSDIQMEVGENLHFLGVPQELHSSLAGIHDLTELPVTLHHSSGKIIPGPEKGVYNPFPKSDKELSILEIVKTFGATNEGIKESTRTAETGQVRQAVLEFYGSSFSPSFLKVFQEHYDIPETVVKVVGTPTMKESSVETDLDVQTITAIAQEVETWEFTFDTLLDWVDAIETIMTTENSPKVLSVSYASLESENSISSMHASNIAFMKIGLAGFTWFNAAGDSGPALNPNSGCKTFDPYYPATSPYVTAVGGTKIYKSTGIEGAWINGGGGFSTVFDRPAFQKQAVETYLEEANFPNFALVNGGKRVFNTTGRAIPDVAAFGSYFPMYYAPSFYPIGGGTSAAAPQWTGLLALVNNLRYQNGLGPIGPINQILYSMPNGVGTDITHGQTYASSRKAICKDLLMPGFYSWKGWDATTGLGSPVFENLVDAMATLGSKDEQFLRSEQRFKAIE